MKWLRDVLTDDEGDFDIVSLLAALACVVFLTLTVYAVVWKDKDLNGTEYGVAVGSLIATLGGAYRLKRKDKEKAP